MILKNLKLLDIQRLGDADDGVEAGISDDSLPFVFEILSTKFYSNPIGSIIREITSNCFDSHMEAGVDEPVLIKKTYNVDEGYSIEFQDFGVGLSVERMYRVYMNYFSSTKRETNDLIGGFGLGSKTPLSYTDYFYITTVFDGLRYEYLYHKGEKKPTLESLSGYDEVVEEYTVNAIIEDGEEVELEEPITKTKIRRIPTGTPTEDRNGTTIRIVIESGDESKFEKELGLQLSYFDNVYFTGWRVSNDYAIYEGRNFIFRSDIGQRSTEIHICIGKVRYAIDFNQIAITREFRNIPIGIKFEIGDLQITPNRESIRYDEQSIGLIRQRIDLALEEITDLYNKQNPEIETLEEYVKSIGSEAKVIFNKEKGHAIDLWSYSTLSKTFKFKPLSGLNLKKSPTDLFFGWECLGRINQGVYVVNGYGPSSVSNKDILKGDYIIIDKETKFSKYTDINLYRELGNILIFRKKSIDFNEIERTLGIGNSKKQEGKARLIYNYNKIIGNIVKGRSSGNYKDFRPTEEWIAAYKKEQKEATLAAKRKLNKTVFVRIIRGINNSSGVDMREYDLNNRTGILVYGLKEDKSKLEKIYDMVTDNVKTIRNLNYNKRDKAFLVLQVAKSTEPYIIGAKKTIYWGDFIKTKFFNNIYSAYKIEGMISSSNLKEYGQLKKDLIPGYSKDMDLLNSLIDKYIGYRSIYFDSLIDSRDIAVSSSMLKIFNTIKDRYKDVKIPFQYTIDDIPTHEEDRGDYIDYLKYRKLRILNVFYLKDKKQLEYEGNIRTILDTIKGKIKPQLLLTINQNENGNEDSNNQESCDSSEIE